MTEMKLKHERQKTRQKRPGRPKGKIDKTRVTYHLPKQLVKLVSDQAYTDRIPHSELLSRILIGYFAGKKIKPKPKPRSLAEIAKEKGLAL